MLIHCNFHCYANCSYSALLRVVLLVFVPHLYHTWYKNKTFFGSRRILYNTLHSFTTI